VQGRNTQGVRLLETEEGDKVKSLAKVVERDDEKDAIVEKDGPVSPVAGNA
jgi:hypothetical protein